MTEWIISGNPQKFDLINAFQDLGKIYWRQSTNIQKGDIIKLDTKVSDELGVFVGNIKKFYAFPGTSSDSYAVKISQVINEEE